MSYPQPPQFNSLNVDLGLSGRVIIVTGAASGIGRSIAQALAKQNVSLALCDLNLASLTKTALELNLGESKIFHKAVDVTDADGVEAFVKEAAQKFGSIDGMCHCAGINPAQDVLHSQAPSLTSAILNINLQGTINFNAALLRQLTSQSNPPPGGFSIVNTGSIASLIGIPGSSIYCASKHAVLGLTRALAKEYAEKGVRVNAVAPGAIDTPLLSGKNLSEEVLNAPLSIKRTGSADECAQIYLFLLSPMSSYVTGALYQVDGGWFC